MERKNLMSTLREHKQSKMSFALLALSVVVILIMSLIIRYDAVGFDLTLLFVVINVAIIGGAALYYESRNLSFFAHLIVLILFLEPNLRGFYNFIFDFIGGRYPSLLNFINLIIGTILSIYMILKLIAHNSEIKSFFPSFNRRILTLLAIVLIGLYLINDFSTVLLYAFLMIIAALTGGSKMTLPVVLMIYLARLSNIVQTATLFRAGLTGAQQTNIIINSIFYIFIIYYTIRLMREEDQTAIYH